jgi:hypothetical protein
MVLLKLLGSCHDQMLRTRSYITIAHRPSRAVEKSSPTNVPVPQFASAGAS